MLALWIALEWPLTRVTSLVVYVTATYLWSGRRCFVQILKPNCDLSATISWYRPCWYDEDLWPFFRRCRVMFLYWDISHSVIQDWLRLRAVLSHFWPWRCNLRGVVCGQRRVRSFVSSRGSRDASLFKDAGSDFALASDIGWGSSGFYTVATNDNQAPQERTALPGTVPRPTPSAD